MAAGRLPRSDRERMIDDRVGRRMAEEVGKYESGANRISASRLWLLTEALGLPMSFFFDGIEGSPSVSEPHEDTGRGAVQMMRAFGRITDDRVRGSLLELAQALSAPQLKQVA